MRKRRRRFAAIAASVLAIVALAWGIQVWRRPQVNILLITLDTTRADRIGCYGYRAAQTPTIDRLASQGTLFERALAPIPLTLPSHASMLTGLYPPEHGLITNGHSTLPTTIPTLADSLSEKGYSTAAFVAAFVLGEKFGLSKGFDVYDDDLSTAAPNPDELHRFRDGKFVTDNAIKWLAQHAEHRADAPFFCWVHLYDPHDPYIEHRDQYGDRFAGRAYDAEIAYVDDQIKRLIDLLASTQLDQNTVIVIVGDHGEGLGDHGERLHGHMLYESTVRVPLIVYRPGVVSAGNKVSTTVSLIDLYPTLLELTGGTPPKPVSGQTLVPLLEGKSAAERSCYVQTDEPYFESLWSPLRSITNDRWKYVRTTKPELYDLTADPGERNNLIAERPEMVHELEEQLADIEKQMTPAFGTSVADSEEDRKMLESLGYTGGKVGGTTDGKPLSDIKDMISALNRSQTAVELIYEKKYAEAVEILEQVTEEVPNYFKALLNLGYSYLELKRYDEAIVPLERALAIDPQSNRVLMNLGFVRLKQGELDKAFDIFSRTARLHPNIDGAQLYLGEIHQRQGRIEQARRHYRACLQINPSNRAAQQALEFLSKY
ncbi:MAG: sulfatase-like hydrolase/transferase [Planctomycetaceae bacterium]